VPQLGEHGMWCKYTNFENQVRVPMLVRVPWLPQSAGQHSGALVECPGGPGAVKRPSHFPM
jgi:hypothetical protein